MVNNQFNDRISFRQSVFFTKIPLLYLNFLQPTPTATNKNNSKSSGRQPLLEDPPIGLHLHHWQQPDEPPLTRLFTHFDQYFFCACQWAAHSPIIVTQQPTPQKFHTGIFNISFSIPSYSTASGNRVRIGIPKCHNSSDAC